MAIPEISPGAGFHAKRITPHSQRCPEDEEIDFSYPNRRFLDNFNRELRAKAGGLDITKIDIHGKIDALVYNQVVLSAEISQEEHDTPFEVGDLVFYPTSEKIYEVTKIFDNRHRIAMRNEIPYLLTGRHDKEYESLNAYSVLHLYYLIKASVPYDPRRGYITGNMEEIKKILSELVDEKEKPENPQ